MCPKGSACFNCSESSRAGAVIVRVGERPLRDLGPFLSVWRPAHEG